MALLSDDPYDTSHKILNGIVVVLLVLLGVLLFVGVIASMRQSMQANAEAYQEQQHVQDRANRRAQMARRAPVVTPPMVDMREKIEKAKTISAEIQSVDTLIAQMRLQGVDVARVVEYRTYLMDKLRATLSPPVLEREEEDQHHVSQ